MSYYQDVSTDEGYHMLNSKPFDVIRLILIFGGLMTIVLFGIVANDMSSVVRGAFVVIGVMEIALGLFVLQLRKGRKLEAEINDKYKNWGGGA
jgi:hypothetical protein